MHILSLVKKLTMSLCNDIMKFSILGFRSDIRIELQAPVVIYPFKYFQGYGIMCSILLLTFMNMECLGKLIMAILACLLQGISDIDTHPPLQNVSECDQEIPQS